MCGIVGFLDKAPSKSPDDRMRVGLARLRHRGPDDSGLAVFQGPSGWLGLGQTRLSIIDLSTGGHQPMYSDDKRYVIVYNGEVYNYKELREELAAAGERFRSDSDTEVLLKAWIRWGSECLLKFKGMFAFVIYDQKENSLSVVRDAFGIKPLFYYLRGTCFAFASEVPALLAVLPDKPDMNWQRSYDYLRFGDYDTRETTFYKDIKHLMPGHFFVLDLDHPADIEPIRWWYPRIEERPSLSFEEAAENVRERFLQNIKLHLRSDVPLGAALSGGIDSSAVVCAMRHLEKDIPIHTFTYVARNSPVDEERWADVVNQHVGAVPHKVVVTPHELVDDLDDMIRAQGEPFGSTSIYAQYRVFRLAKESGITVTLDGQGADEMLAGYSGYPNSRMQSMAERMEIADLFRFAWGWGGYPGRSRKKTIFALRKMFKQVYFPKKARHKSSKCPAWFNTDSLKGQGVQLGLERPLCLPDAKGRRLAEALRYALTGYGIKQLLRHGDRNAMRWSIESRVPFLTHDFAEYLLSLPEEYLVSPAGETKHVFRAAMRGIVPDAILDRKDKIGFQTPEGNWLRTIGPRLFDWVSVLEQLPFLNAAECRKEIQSTLDGTGDPDWKVWRMINFCRWVELQEVRA